MLENFPDIMTPQQLSKALGIGKNAAYELLKSGDIQYRRVGSRYIIPKLCILDFLYPQGYNGSRNGGIVPVSERSEI